MSTAGGIYFSTITDISPDEELKVWYDPFNAQVMPTFCVKNNDTINSVAEIMTNNVHNDNVRETGDSYENLNSTNVHGCYSLSLQSSGNTASYGCISRELPTTEVVFLELLNPVEVLPCLNDVTDQRSNYVANNEQNGVDNMNNNNNETIEKKRPSKNDYAKKTRTKLLQKIQNAKLKCSVCNSVFMRTEALRKHNCQKKVLSAMKNRCICYVCNQSFTSRKLRSEHCKTSCKLANQDGSAKFDKRLTCDICHLQYKSCLTFNLHREQHMGLDVQNTGTFVSLTGDETTIDPRVVTFERSKERKLQNVLHLSCTSCNRKFKSNTSLTLHMKQYHEDGDFICNICHETFTTKYKLSYHITRCHKERLYECDICRKKYTGQSSYYNHIKFHLRSERKPSK